MADQNNKKVDALAQEITLKSRGQGKLRQFILWMGALIIGAILGWQHYLHKSKQGLSLVH